MLSRSITVVLVCALLAGCASRWNPLNWFGRDRPEEGIARTAPVAQDPRPLIDEVLRISAEPAQGGAILRAVGLAATQGYYDAELEQIPAGPGILAFRFRVMPPPEPARVSSAASREIQVATFLSDQTLQGIRQIQVLGARASRSIRR